MATLSASTRSHPHHQQDQMVEGSYSEHEAHGPPTIESWRTLADAMTTTIRCLNVEEELKEVAGAESAVRIKVEERNAIINNLKAEVQALGENLKRAKLDAKRPQNQPTPEAHRAEVKRVEREIEQIEQKLTEEQSLVREKQVDLRKWEDEQEEVIKLEVGDEGAWADGKVIRLKLFTEAGFTLIPGQGNTASKVLIRDEEKSDIHTLSLDNSRSKTHNANFIWGLAGE